jgi:outer membrane receptor for ferrienterochelin and colicins
LLIFTVSQAASIKGQVIDANTSFELASANIYFSASRMGTVSDDRGYFSLKTPNDGSDTLIVKVIGYQEYKQVVKFPLESSLLVQMISVVLHGDDVIVSATRIPGSAAQSSLSLDVITPNELRLQLATHVSDALQGLRSLQIRDYGGSGAMKTVSLRGATAGQTLVVLDGQRLNNPQNGEVDFALIPLEHIQGIEILRGGSSALYGADAMGGVISIKTKRAFAERIQISTELGIGSYGTYAFKTNLAISKNKTDFISSYQYFQSAGNFTYKDMWGREFTRDNNDATQHHVYSRFSWHPKNWKLSLAYDLMQSEKGAPGPIEPYYHFARMDDRRQYTSLDIEKTSENRRHVFKSQSYYLYSLNHYVNEDSSDVLVPVNDTYINQTFGEELQFTSTFRPELVLNYGVNVRLDEFHHQRLDLKYTRLSYDAFIIDESDFTFNNKLIKGLKISPSLRYNGNTDFVDKLTPKIGLLLHLLDDGQLKILANTGLSYRSPTFNDLYWPKDSFSRGNQNLRPESGRDWDAGIRLKVEGLKVDVVYFDQYYTDLILWQDHAGMWWPENVSEARIRGLENSFKWDIISDHLDLYAQYTFMDARNLSQQYDNKYLSYRPVHTADIQLNGKILSLGMFFNTHIESKRYTTADNAEIRALPAYIKNDIGMNFLQKTSFVDILYKAEIKNLFDVDYQLLKDYPLAGREIKLSIQIKFNKQMKERK